MAENLSATFDPGSDPDAIWSAVGKPITGIGGGRYKLTEQYLFFERGTLSTKAQQISAHETFDVDAMQTITQKARGVGTVVLDAIRSGGGTRERVELVDVERSAKGLPNSIVSPMRLGRTADQTADPDRQLHRGTRCVTFVIDEQRHTPHRPECRTREACEFQRTRPTRR